MELAFKLIVTILVASTTMLVITLILFGVAGGLLTLWK